MSEGLILYCDCAYSSLITDEAKVQIKEHLAGSGWRVEAVPDLCKLAAEQDKRLKRWAGEDDLVIVACYPRTVKWLFHYGKAALSEGVRILNMREQRPEEVLAALTDLERCNKAPALLNVEPDGDWVPWFPVIDYDRCSNCGQCASFCVFGVYRVTPDERVEVLEPANCKNNCPACARMCPSKAIIFAKCSEVPINGAEPPAVEETSSSSEGADIDALIEKRRARAEAFRKAREGSNKR